jgi:cytochrome c
MRSIVVSMVATIPMMVGSAMAAEIPAEMPVLAKKNNCTDCHAIDKKIVGPSWLDVARKYKGVAEFEYKGKKYPLQEGLIMKVSKGGAGNWGPMPMPINDPSGAKQADIKELVQFVLGLAK